MKTYQLPKPVHVDASKHPGQWFGITEERFNQLKAALRDTGDLMYPNEGDKCNIPDLMHYVTANCETPAELMVVSLFMADLIRLDRETKDKKLIEAVLKDVLGLDIEEK